MKGLRKTPWGVGLVLAAVVGLAGCEKRPAPQTIMEGFSSEGVTAARRQDAVPAATPNHAPMPGGHEGHDARSTGNAPQAGQAHFVDVPLPRSSYFDIAATWTDQNGKSLGLKSFKGHKIIVSFMYTTCPDVCPLQTEQLKQALALLPPEKTQGVRVILITIDPEHDTPKALKAFAVKHNLDESRFTLLTSEPMAIEVAASLSGYNFQHQHGQVFHNLVVALTDTDGYVRWAIHPNMKNLDPHQLAEDLARGL